MGHEFIGVIEEIGENPKLKVGDRVVGEINLACESCIICDRGGIAKRNHCPQRSVLGILNKDGTFAEYLTLPVCNLYLVPDSVTDEVGLFAEPLAAAFRIVEQVPFTGCDKIAVIGDGRLGNLITQALSFKTKELTAFGKHQTKLDRIPQSNVVKVLVGTSTEEDYRDTFDVCVEATGNPNGLMMAGVITKPLGTVVLKSTCATKTSSFDSTNFVVKEITIIGSRCGNFPMALEALQKGEVKVGALIDHKYPFDKALEAIEKAGTKGVLKVQMCME